MKKKHDPLWEIVGEKIALQGSETSRAASCPNCHVLVDLRRDLKGRDQVRCGLCGALCEVASKPDGAGLVLRVVSRDS